MAKKCSKSAQNLKIVPKILPHSPPPPLANIFWKKQDPRKKILPRAPSDKITYLIILNYEIFSTTFESFLPAFELSFKPSDLFEYIKIIPPFISSWQTGIMYKQLL